MFPWIRAINSRRPISWITLLYFRETFSHNLLFETLAGRTRGKSPTDFELDYSAFFPSFVNCHVNNASSRPLAGIFRSDVAERRDSRHWPRKLCDAGDPRFREVERACRAVTRMEEFRRARAFHEVSRIDRSNGPTFPPRPDNRAS